METHVFMKKEEEEEEKVEKEEKDEEELEKRLECSWGMGAHKDYPHTCIGKRLNKFHTI